MADNNTKQDDGSLAFLNIPRKENSHLYFIII